jgi:CBS domain containing-hemolysin-like protein
VTIEDLLEEIVGAISDEHEHEPDDSPQPDGAGGFLVPGSFEVSRMETLWGEADKVELPETNATTVGGLVAELSGRIPLPGEVVPAGNLRLEVMASTGRRVERVRVGLNGNTHAGAGADDDPPE